MRRRATCVAAVNTTESERYSGTDEKKIVSPGAGGLRALSPWIKPRCSREMASKYHRYPALRVFCKKYCSRQKIPNIRDARTALLVVLIGYLNARITRFATTATIPETPRIGRRANFPSAVPRSASRLSRHSLVLARPAAQQQGHQTLRVVRRYGCVRQDPHEYFGVRGNDSRLA